MASLAPAPLRANRASSRTSARRSASVSFARSRYQKTGAFSTDRNALPVSDASALRYGFRERPAEQLLVALAGVDNLGQPVAAFVGRRSARMAPDGLQDRVLEVAMADQRGQMCLGHRPQARHRPLAGGRRRLDRRDLEFHAAPADVEEEVVLRAVIVIDEALRGPEAPGDVVDGRRREAPFAERCRRRRMDRRKRRVGLRVCPGAGEIARRAGPAPGLCGRDRFRERAAIRLHRPVWTYPRV